MNVTHAWRQSLGVPSLNKNGNMEQNKDLTVAIVERFFTALRILIEGKVMRGLQTFTRTYGLNRRNVQRLQHEPQSGIFRAGWLTYLVEDFRISPTWLLTGRGGVFLDGWDCETLKKVQLTGNRNRATVENVDNEEVAE